MPAAQDPIRQRLIEARRSQILDAAAKVFAERGFHRATTKQIASQAGVAEGTIYNYFDSKSDLLIGVMMRLSAVEDMGTELTHALDDDARSLLLAITRHRMALIEQNYQTLQAILPEMLINPSLRDRFYKEFAQPMTALLERYVLVRMESGHGRPVDTRLAVRFVQGVFIGLMILRILGDDMLERQWNALPEVMVDLLLDGLSAHEVV